MIYIQRDDKVRNARLVKHKVGEATPEEDIILYEESDESVWLSLEVSKCKNFFLMIKVSKAGSEVGFAH